MIERRVSSRGRNLVVAPAFSLLPRAWRKWGVRLARPRETRAPLTAHKELPSMSSHDTSGTEQHNRLGVRRLNPPSAHPSAHCSTHLQPTPPPLSQAATASVPCPPSPPPPPPPPDLSSPPDYESAVGAEKRAILRASGHRPPSLASPGSRPLTRTDRRRPPVLADNKSHIP